MEQELGVPWEDVFDHIEPEPLAAGTIAQVHRATLANGDEVVVKVQRPDAKELIEQDLALLEVFAEKVGIARGLKQVIDMEAVFDAPVRLAAPGARLPAGGGQHAPDDGGDRIVLAVARARGARRLLHVAPAGDARRRRADRSRTAPEGTPRKEAARQLLESFYKQIMVDGFFHADPHPGNLMWQPEEELLYFLDLGMVGEVSAEMREQMMLLLMAFWQEDVGFLTDISLMLSGAIDRSDLDVDAFSEEIGALMAKNRDGVAQGHPARAGAAGDDRDLAPPRRAAARLAHAHRQGARADAAGRRAARPRARSVRCGREVPDAQRLHRHGVEVRPEGGLLSDAEDEGPRDAGHRGGRTADRRAARARSSR